MALPEIATTEHLVAARPELLDYSESAEFLHVSERTVYRMVQAGALPYVQLGGRVLFLREDLIAAVHAARVDRRESPGAA